jgi:HTH-type transcriptional regulator/antitoxin HigA
MLTEQEYNQAIARYEQIKDATAGAERKEKLLLVHLIENYENSLWDISEVNENAGSDKFFNA